MSPPTEGVTEMPEIFAFETSGEAYNASQTNEAISDGDILVVASEGVAAILISAWPTLAAGTEFVESAFHPLEGGYAAYATLDGGKYAVSACIAQQLVTPEGVLTEDGKAAVAASEAREQAEHEAWCNENFFIDPRDATRKELADEDDSRLAHLERLETERQRVWSDDDEAGEHVFARCGHRLDSGAYDCPDCGH